jgi:hypothetical protein
MSLYFLESLLHCFGKPKALIFIRKSGRSSHTSMLGVLERECDFNRHGKYAFQGRYYDESNEESGVRMRMVGVRIMLTRAWLLRMILRRAKPLQSIWPENKWLGKFATHYVSGS